MSIKGTRGFTLLEVLVALAILATALAAVARASNLMTESAGEMKMRTLATWVAQNRLAEHTARRDWPETGSRRGTAENGGARFEWEENVSPTPNVSFRRVEIRIFAAGEPQRQLAQLVGYLGKQTGE